MKHRAFVAGTLLATIVIGGSGCTRAPQTTLEGLLEARRLSAELLVQFSNGADAANRAVMADTDEASTAFAAEAEQAGEAIWKDVDELGRLLASLGFSDEARLLADFTTRFDAYRGLDREILALAVENTNVKAQRLSFGPAQGAVDGLRDSLNQLSAPGETSEVAALIGTAMAAVREIQVLQAPHIAEPDEQAMSRIETAMAAAEQVARDALRRLAAVLPPTTPAAAAATAALDRFTVLNAEIVALSRRNTNVRSLAMTLGQKRTLTAACEERLVALQQALGTRGFAATR